MQIEIQNRTQDRVFCSIEDVVNNIILTHLDIPPEGVAYPNLSLSIIEVSVTIFPSCNDAWNHKTHLWDKTKASTINTVRHPKTSIILHNLLYCITFERKPARFAHT